MKKIFYVMALLTCFTLTFLGTTSCSNQAATVAQKAAIRSNDIADCNNLMGLHVWYHGSFLNNIELEKCWVTTDEFKKTATWAQNANYWIGMDNIKAYYGPVTPHEQTKGGFQFHATTTGVVEIAEDRKTAKGVWYTPGAIGMGGSIQGMWERYGIDFVNENGVWKIWHLHVYTDFSFSMKSGSGGGMGGGMGGAPQGAGGQGGSQGAGGQGGSQGAGGQGGAPQGAGGQGAPQMAQGGGAATGGAPAGGQGGAPTGAPAGGAPQQAAAGGQGGEKAEKFGSEASQATGGGGGGARVAAQATAEVGYKEVGNDSYADLIPRPPEPYKTFSDTWSYGDPDEVKMFSGGYKEWSEIKAQYKK